MAEIRVLFYPPLNQLVLSTTLPKSCRLAVGASERD